MATLLVVKNATKLDFRMHLLPNVTGPFFVCFFTKSIV